ncbi:unnamed protein product [Durusdinium trenchii]|uniref:Uncharacterized protein n=1 Tax=Durusdinium trenchii TaxID=1381693 RepID=A0ABP0RU47_9DINO
MPEANAIESLGDNIAEDLLASALLHEMQHKEQAQRESSEVLSATQVSDAATIPPEAARDDEERLEAQRTLQSSLREALNMDPNEAGPSSDVLTASESAMVKYCESVAEELLDLAMQQMKHEQAARRSSTPSRISDPSLSNEVAVIEALGQKLAEDLLNDADQQSKVSRPASEVTIMPSQARKTKDELLDEIDILASSLTVDVLQPEDRPSSGQSARGGQSASVVTADASEPITELVHNWVQDSLPSQADTQPASQVCTEGSELLAPSIERPEDVAQDAASLASGPAVSVATSQGSLQVAKATAFHALNDTIEELRSAETAPQEVEAHVPGADVDVAAMAQDLLDSAAAATAHPVRAASLLTSEVSVEILPVISVQPLEASSEVESARSGGSQEDPKKDYSATAVHQMVAEVLEHQSLDQDSVAPADPSEVETTSDRLSFGIAGPESVCSAGFEEAALLQAAVGAELLSEAGDLLELTSRPASAHTAHTAASLEERIVAEVAGDLLPEQNPAKILALVKELQRRSLQEPEVELHFSGPGMHRIHRAEASATLSAKVPEDAQKQELSTGAESKKEMFASQPRFTALEAESSSGAEPTSVPGKPAVSQDRLHVLREEEIDPITIAAEALARDVASQEIEAPSEKTPSLGEQTVSDLSVDTAAFGLPKEVTEKMMREASAAIQAELDLAAIVAKALAQDVLSKEVEEELDPVALASQALALDVMSKEVEVEEVLDPLGPPVSIASEALALDAMSHEVSAEHVPEPEEEPEGPAEDQDVVPPEQQSRRVRPPAGSGAAAAVAARRLAEHTIEGMIKLHERENRDLEALVKKKFYTPAPGTKLPTVSSLPSLGMGKGKACDETKRILRLNYHRVLNTPTVYQEHRPRSAADMDLREDLKLHNDPELQEKRFLRQRGTYQAVPGNVKAVSPQKKSKSVCLTPMKSQSAPLLPPATGADRGPPKLRPLAKGANNLLKLKDGAPPARLLWPGMRAVCSGSGSRL